MPLLDESLAISSELGMRSPMERVLSRREILGALQRRHMFLAQRELVADEAPRLT